MNVNLFNLHHPGFRRSDAISLARSLALVLCLIFTSHCTFSQVKVYYNDKEVSQDTLPKIISSKQKDVEQDINSAKNAADDLENKAVKHFVDSAQSDFRKTHGKSYDSASDVANRISTIAGSPPENYRQVYSEKAIKAIYDSLGIDQFSKLPVKEITEEDLVTLVNDKFSTHPLLDAQDSIKRNLPAAGDLSKQRLARSSLFELAPLTGQVMKSKYLEKLDSIRNVNLQAQGLELKERSISEFGKIAELKEELNFWDRSYFEGIIGIANVDQFFVQLSPAMGYHFLGDLSGGIGPVINLYEESEKKMVTVGFRPFLKQEFLKRRAYFQAEYVMNPFLDDAESIGINKHNTLVGGGVLFPISQSIAINLCVMHRFNNSEAERLDNAASWTFRIGISSTKVKK